MLPSLLYDFYVVHCNTCLPMSAASNQSTGFTDDASEVQGFHAAELQGWDPDFVSGLAAAFDHSEVQDLSLSGQSWDADTVTSVYDSASHQEV